MARVEFPADVDYYEIMHVHPKAHPAVIRKVYHVLMLELKNHPDLGGDVRAAQMINEAYAVLSDNEKRDEYDRFRLRQSLNGETPTSRPSSPGSTSSATSAGAAQGGATSGGPKSSASASSQAQQAAPKQATVSMDLLPDLEEALSTLSAWPPRRVTPPFCKGRLALLEKGPLLNRFGFLPAGVLAAPDPKVLEGFDLRAYVQPKNGAHLAALSYNGIILAGILKAERDVMKTDGLMKGFVNEISGDGLDVDPVVQLMNAVEFLDTGERRRRSKALGLWLVSVSRDPKYSGIVLAGYPF